MARPEKVGGLDEIRAKLADADAAVLTEYRGLTVTELAELRGRAAPRRTEYKVFKNTLARRAAEDAGLAEIVPLLEGPVAIAFVTGDAVIAAKALRTSRKTNPNLVVKGGLLGDRVLTPADMARSPTCRPATCCSPGSPAGSRPRSSRPPACSRPSPATWPTASRPSSTSGSRAARRSGDEPRRRRAGSRAEAAAEAAEPPKLRPRRRRRRAPAEAHRGRRASRRQPNRAADQPRLDTTEGESDRDGNDEHRRPARRLQEHDASSS